MLLYQTAERVSYTRVVDNVNFQRHLFAYMKAAAMIRGTVIEIGCGDGYGIKILIDHCDHYVAIDKNRNTFIDEYNNIDFFRIVLPRLKNIPSNIFDYAVSFQVIEHIKDDSLFLTELRRILKPGGKLLLTTPNILRSASRNPWHVREYALDEIRKKLSGVFSKINIMGIYGDDKVEEYLGMNKKHVQALYRYDVFNLRTHLPAWMLRFPYDVLNMVQKKQLSRTSGLAPQITCANFYIGDASDGCLDFFVEAIK